jgi:hypothetical protein
VSDPRCQATSSTAEIHGSVRINEPVRQPIPRAPPWAVAFFGPPPSRLFALPVDSFARGRGVALCLDPKGEREYHRYPTRRLLPRFGARYARIPISPGINENWKVEWVAVPAWSKAVATHRYPTIVKWGPGYFADDDYRYIVAPTLKTALAFVGPKSFDITHLQRKVYSGRFDEATERSVAVWRFCV